MNVLVKPYLFIRESLGSGELALELEEGATVSDLLELLRKQRGLPDTIVSRHGELTLFEGNVPVGMTILINGHNIKQLQGNSTPLKEGAVVAIFPPAAGG